MVATESEGLNVSRDDVESVTRNVQHDQSVSEPSHLARRTHSFVFTLVGLRRERVAATTTKRRRRKPPGFRWRYEGRRAGSAGLFDGPWFR